MTDTNDQLLAYIEADAPVRAGHFNAFLDALAALKRDEGAAAAMRLALRAVSPLLDYTSLTRLGKHIPSGSGGASGNPLRLAVLGGPTTIQIVRLLEIFLASQGIDAALYQSEYGLFRQELLMPDSGLDAFKPQVIFLAIDARDVSRLPSLKMGREELGRLLDDELGSWEALWETARGRWGATVLQNTFVSPDYPSLGHLSSRCPAAPGTYLSLLNRRIAEQAPHHVCLHDLQLLASDVGFRHWFDPRFYLEAKMPCAPECLVPYAHSVASLVRAIRGKSKKVLVLDLDNTVWGGVIGDVGVEGICLGQGSGEGEAFLAFQRYAVSLHERGVLLAVCSKNDDARAREPFLQRSDMPIRLEHVSCFVANWQDKAHNLRHIAHTLNLGLDSLVFADDNPAERALVRRLVPEVAVPDMPEDPARYAQAIALHQYFETVSFTIEDAQRSKYYRDNARRGEMAAQSGDVDSFLRSLDMVASVTPVAPLNIQRVSQLLNKSNQFNLTTRRYTQAELEEIAGDPEWSTLTISLRDRCGDNGLISILLLRQEGRSLAIDTWVMSCRVLKRGVEALALRRIVEIARARGCTVVEGRFIPTEKNGMVREHYARLGFGALGSDDDTTRWRLDLMDDLSLPACHIREELSS